MRGMLSVLLGVMCVGVAACAPPGAGGADTADIALASADVEREPGDAAAIPSAVASVEQLAARLYADLADDRAGEGLAYSPFSIAVALAMTANGAVGETAEEMLDVLGVEDREGLNAGLNALTQHVESLAGVSERPDGSEAEVILDVANALFGEQSTTWGEEFLADLARDYGAGMREVDFVGAPEPARELINAWTADQTHDKIDELLPPGSINAMVRLVLVNAVYLKAAWAVPFDADDTEERPFRLEDGSRVEVPMMSAQLDDVAYGAGEGWEAVRLPYVGDGLAMTVVLPELGRLADVEAAVGAGGLGAILAAPRPAPVDLRLPRSEVRTDIALAEVLADRGMPRAFSDLDAQFGPMTGEPERNGLFIGEVFHEAFVAVDEEGAEAAAATGVVMLSRSAPSYQPFLVDRPFLFVIHDVEHRTPLFVGRVMDPSA